MIFNTSNERGGFDYRTSVTSFARADSAAAARVARSPASHPRIRQRIRAARGFEQARKRRAAKPPRADDTIQYTTTMSRANLCHKYILYLYVFVFAEETQCSPPHWVL
jgi:hypothetical protein